MDPKVVAAQAKLRAAIVEYYEELYPGSFIDDWTVVVHRQTVRMEENGESSVSTTIPEHQPLYRTLGLLESGLSILKQNTHSTDDYGQEDAHPDNW